MSLRENYFKNKGGYLGGLGTGKASKIRISSRDKISRYISTPSGIVGKIGIAALTTGILSKTMKSTTNIGNNFMRGLHPRSSYPVASGRFGVRVSSQSTPAGISGLKFNFRKR